jgi:hypothetical protein
VDAGRAKSVELIRMSTSDPIRPFKPRASNVTLWLILTHAPQNHGVLPVVSAIPRWDYSANGVDVHHLGNAVL